MEWLVNRRLITTLGLVFLVGFAGVLAMGWSPWFLRPLRWLGEYQAFHIVAHFSIFACLILSSRGARFWRLALGGGALIELAQITVGGFALTRPLVQDCLFDLAIDLIGAASAWAYLAYRRRSDVVGQGRVLRPL
jgi:hypothetical protein